MEVRYHDLPFGITTIDTGLVHPGFAASHLVVFIYTPPFPKEVCIDFRFGN